MDFPFTLPTMPLTKAQLSRVRSLKEKKHREVQGLFVVEGEKVVRELLQSGFPLVELFSTQPVASWAASVPVHGITPDEMSRISHFPSPSPVLAIGRLDRRALKDDELRSGLTLALDGLQDAGNVGTMLRIADWFGFDRVLLSPDCADLFSQKVINASMGSFSRVRSFSTDLATALAGVRALVPVYGCDLQGTPLSRVRPTKDAIVVIGNEGRGLTPAVAACLTERITIPRFGAAESLNAAVAAGIVCAQLRIGRMEE